VGHVAPESHLLDELASLCDEFEEQNQALRSRIVEVMSFAEHQVAARVEAGQAIVGLQAELVALGARITELEAQLARTEQALHAIEHSTLFRVAAPARSMWAKVRSR
jgi:chromosome segregation ATPase